MIKDPEVQALAKWFHDLREPSEQARRMSEPPAQPKPHPCEKCGEETLYSPQDAVNLHTREPLDRWDNRYACARDYSIHHDVQGRCRLCSQLIVQRLPIDVTEPTDNTCWMCKAVPPGTGEPA